MTGQGTLPEGSRRLTVAVTRPLPAGRELARQLEARGFRPLLGPTLEIAPARDPAALRAAAERALRGRYHWTVFTSANGVRAFADALARLGQEGTPPKSRIAAVGGATAAAAQAQGWPVDRVARRATAEGLLEDLGERIAGLRVLLPAAEEARDVLPRGLAARGAEVEVVVAYRSVTPPEVQALARAIRAGEVDALTFASPSSARNLVQVAGEEALAVPAVVIGPVTREAVERLGFRVVVEAGAQSTEGLVEAVSAWARDRSGLR